MIWVYNSINTEAATNAPTVLGVCILLIILSSLSVGLRFYVRAKIVRIVTIGMTYQQDMWRLSADNYDTEQMTGLSLQPGYFLSCLLRLLLLVSWFVVKYNDVID